MALVGEGAAQVIAPDYNEIDPAIEAQLITEALGQNPELAAATSRYALLTLDGSSPYSNVARSLERRQFEDYFGNTPEDMAVEYGPYETQSSFFLVVDREKKEAAGVMRIIRPGEAGLKSSNDLPSDKCKTIEGEPVTDLTTPAVFSSMQLDPLKTLDIATIAVRPDHGEKATGSPVVLAALMRALHGYTNSNGYDELVAIIDAVPLEKLQAAGLPINFSSRVVTPFVYLGAKGNSFMHIHVPDCDAAIMAHDKVTYDYMLGDMNLLGECELSFIEQ